VEKDGKKIEILFFLFQKKEKEKMQTRSQTIYQSFPLYEVCIDFDEASEAWKANKKSIGNGSYKYVCNKRGIKNKMCLKKCLPGEEYCQTHLRMHKKEIVDDNS